MGGCAPTVVSTDTHHAVINEQIDHLFRQRVGEVAVMGLFGTRSAVVNRVAAVHTFQGIVGGVQLKGAVGDEQQTTLRLIGKSAPIDVRAMVVLLRADIRLVHILDRDGVLSDELGGTAVSVILFRTATVVGQVCKAFRQLHPQAYTRYHRSLVSFGHEPVVYLDDSAGIYLIGDVPTGVCLWKTVDHLYCRGIAARSHLETFGFRFLVACLFPGFEADGEVGSIIIVRRCTPEEWAGTLTVQYVLLLLV